MTSGDAFHAHPAAPEEPVAVDGLPRSPDALPEPVPSRPVQPRIPGLPADQGRAKSWLQQAAAQNDAEAKKALDALTK